MTDWPVKTIGEVAVVGAGNSAPQDKELFKNGVHRFVRTSDVGQVRIGRLDQSADLLNDEGTKGLRKFRAGVTLIPKSGASTFLNHRVQLTKPWFVSSHLAVVDPNPKLMDDTFMFYFLQTVRAQDLIQDQSYPSLNLPAISGIEVLVPPLEEQKRIVALLDAATTRVNELRELGSRRSVLETEILSALVDELLAPDDGWTRRPLTDWCIEIGTGPFGSLVHKADYVEAGIPLINPMNIKEGRIVESGIRRVSPGKAVELNRYVLKNGDIVLGRRGEMGRCAVVRPEHEGWICGTGSFFLRPNEECNPDLLALWLSSRQGRVALNAISSGTTMDNLSNKELGLVQVSLPDRPIQDDVVSFSLALEDRVSEMQGQQYNRSHLLGNLRQSILQAAFAGAL